jgi:methionine aminopeptidase
MSVLNSEVTLQNCPVLRKGDVLKVDFGVHVKGRILDSAFTLSWDHTYDKLIEAVKAATNTGVRVSVCLTWHHLFQLFFVTGSRD